MMKDQGWNCVIVRNEESENRTTTSFTLIILTHTFLSCTCSRSLFSSAVEVKLGLQSTSFTTSVISHNVFTTAVIVLRIIFTFRFVLSFHSNFNVISCIFLKVLDVASMAALLASVTLSQSLEDQIDCHTT